MLRASVCTSTQRRYAHAWQRWSTFIALDQPPSGVNRLQEPRSLAQPEVVFALARFMYYLATDLNLSHTNITMTLAGLRHEWRHRPTGSPGRSGSLHLGDVTLYRYRRSLPGFFTAYGRYCLSSCLLLFILGFRGSSDSRSPPITASLHLRSSSVFALQELRRYPSSPHTPSTQSPTPT